MTAVPFDTLRLARKLPGASHVRHAARFSDAGESFCKERRQLGRPRVLMGCATGGAPPAPTGALPNCAVCLGTHRIWI